MGCHFLLQGDLLHPRTELLSLVFPVSAGNFFTTEPPGKADTMHNLVYQDYLSVRDDCLSVMKAKPCVSIKRPLILFSIFF